MSPKNLSDYGMEPAAHYVCKSTSIPSYNLSQRRIWIVTFAVEQPMEIDASQPAEDGPAAAPTVKQEEGGVEPAEATEEPAAASLPPPLQASQGTASTHPPPRLLPPHASAADASECGLPCARGGFLRIQPCQALPRTKLQQRPVCLCCASLSCPSAFVQVDPGVAGSRCAHPIARSSIFPHCPYVAAGGSVVKARTVVPGLASRVLHPLCLQALISRRGGRPSGVMRKASLPLVPRCRRPSSRPSKRNLARFCRASPCLVPPAVFPWIWGSQASSQALETM